MHSHAIPERPELKPWYRLARGDAGVVLEYGGKAIVLEGEATTRLLPALLPLLDGTRTVAEVTETLGEAIEPAVWNAISLLGRHGLLTEGFADGAPPAPLAETARFLAATSQRSANPPAVRERLAGFRAAIAGDSPTASEVARLLRLAGVGDVERGSLGAPVPDTDLVVVAPSPAQLPLLGGWNTAALSAGATWLAALPFDGRIAAIGPLVVPEETCCYECYLLRRASNSGYFAEHRALEREPASHPLPPPAVAATAGLAAVVALRWLVDRDPALPGIMFALELGGAPSLTAHHVYRVPRCPACSTIARSAPVLPWFERDEA